MPADLVVDKEMTFNDKPPAQFKNAFSKMQIKTLNDLADFGVVSSKDDISKMLDATKEVTAVALGNAATFTPFRPVIGTIRPDLRRYGSFVSAISSTHLVEAQTRSDEHKFFWNIVRDIEPKALKTVNATTELRTVLPVFVAQKLFIARYSFNNVTVQAGKILTFETNINSLKCDNLVIERTGLIKIKGSFFKISAYSIKGL